jgi:hypothetical protein
LDDEIADSWRDPEVLRDDMIGRALPEKALDNNSYGSGEQQRYRYSAAEENIDAPDRIPDDYWVVREYVPASFTCKPKLI